MSDDSKAHHLTRDGQIEFHYQKGPLYRTMHVDGFHGGATPRGYIAMSVFSERMPIPTLGIRRVLSTTGDQLTAGPEIIAETLHGLVRHVDATLMLDLNLAKELVTWLQTNIDTLEEKTARRLPTGETKIA